MTTSAEIRRALIDAMQAADAEAARAPAEEIRAWPEDAEAWITPPALAERIAWAMNVKALHDGPLPEPAEFVATALGDLAPADLTQAVRMSESTRAGLGLVLASPAFNRR